MFTFNLLLHESEQYIHYVLRTTDAIGRLHGYHFFSKNFDAYYGAGLHTSWDYMVNSSSSLFKFILAWYSNFAENGSVL